MIQVIETMEGADPVLLVFVPLPVFMFLLFVSAQPLPTSPNRASPTAARTHQQVAP
ncbi:MAG: hypothetical protein L0H96_24665 [Humibacillus sp.]|nr:hypothetical protein [Humibacillus sp.]MDN5780076.1 hypothetical protein [Humibacillus sp.]